MTTEIAPLWVPPVLFAGEVAWCFVWYLALRFVSGIGLPDYIQGLRVDQPAWKSALSFALYLPLALTAVLGLLGIGALFVVAVGSIVTH